MDVNFLEDLIKSYNSATKSFQKNDGMTLCKLEYTSFIDVFGLEGAISEPMDLIDLQGKFERNTKAYIQNSIL